MYKVTEELKSAITKAAVATGSYRKMAQDCGLSGISLSLAVDGHIKALDKTTLISLLPQIRNHLDASERKNIIEFLKRTSDNHQKNGE